MVDMTTLAPPQSGEDPSSQAGFLDRILQATAEAAASAADGPGVPGSGGTEAIPSWFRSLCLCLGQVPDLRQPGVRRAVFLLLTRVIARIDHLLTEQVNAILHHPRFQKLEASWRGLSYLVLQSERGEAIKVRVLSVTWKELARDAERAVEFDQSEVFRKVYDQEFGMPGGVPFSVLIGDYEIRHVPGAEHSIDDLAVLRSLSGVAAAAFAPLILAAHPSLLGLERFGQLERPINLARTFQQEEYHRWRSFRESEDARFVGLTLPRILMRLPYDDTFGSARIVICKACAAHLNRLGGSQCPRCGEEFDPERPQTYYVRNVGFRFREEVEGPDNTKYLWGGASFAFAAVLMRAFADCGWLADIRGFQRGVESGGIVTGLPVHSFSTDRPGVVNKPPVDVAIGDMQEKDLCDLGLIPLCPCKDTDYCVFYGNPSVHKPRLYDTQAATMNARISSMLQYTLCVARFTHYLKVIGRDKVASFSSHTELEDTLNRWLNDYVAPGEHLAPEVKARFPLRQATVEIRGLPDKPGSYHCVVRLWPHYQLDDLTAAVRLQTELKPSSIA